MRSEDVRTGEQKLELCKPKADQDSIRWNEAALSRRNFLLQYLLVALVVVVGRAASNPSKWECIEVVLGTLCILLLASRSLRDSRNFVMFVMLAVVACHIIACTALVMSIWLGKSLHFVYELRSGGFEQGTVGDTVATAIHISGIPQVIFYAAVRLGLGPRYMLWIGVPVLFAGVVALLNIVLHVDRDSRIVLGIAFIWSLFPGLLMISILHDNEQHMLRARTHAFKELEQQHLAASNQQRTVGYIFHEVRNPLNNIMLACELARNMLNQLLKPYPNDRTNSARASTSTTTGSSSALPKPIAQSFTRDSEYSVLTADLPHPPTTSLSFDSNPNISTQHQQQQQSQPQPPPEHLDVPPPHVVAFGVPVSSSSVEFASTVTTTTATSDSQQHVQYLTVNHNSHNLTSKQNLATIEEVSQMVDDIHQSAKAAVRVLNDALNLQKLQSGAFEFVHKPFLLNDLVTTTVGMVHPQMKSKMIEISTVIDPSLQGVAVEGDFHRLQQVLLNYLSNAYKFTPTAGRVEVRMKQLDTVVNTQQQHHHQQQDSTTTITNSNVNNNVFRSSKNTTANSHSDNNNINNINNINNNSNINNNKSNTNYRSPSNSFRSNGTPPATGKQKLRVRTSVHNTGQEINDDDKQKLFRPWSQIRAGDQQQGQGSGLGLALCKAFVEKGHTGTVGFESEPGNGTEFFFDIVFTVSESFDTFQEFQTPSYISHSTNQQLVAHVSSSTSINSDHNVTLELAIMSATLPRKVGTSSPVALQQHILRATRKNSNTSNTSNSRLINNNNNNNNNGQVADHVKHSRTDCGDAIHISGHHGSIVVVGGRSNNNNNNNSDDNDDDDDVLLEMMASARKATPSNLNDDDDGNNNNNNNNNNNHNHSNTDQILNGPGYDYDDEGTASRQPYQSHVVDVLIVEDSAMSRRLLSRTLAAMGVTCDQANDGLEAVEQLQRVGNKHYAVIFMDKEMPRMDGFDATKRIRELGFTRAVIGCTGNVLENQVDEFMQAGANHVMSKPVTQEALGMCLQRLGVAIGSTSTTGPISQQ